VIILPVSWMGFVELFSRNAWPQMVRRSELRSSSYEIEKKMVNNNNGVSLLLPLSAVWCCVEVWCAKVGSLNEPIYVGPNLGPVQPVSIFYPFGSTLGQTFKINGRFFISNIFLRFSTVFTFSRIALGILEPVRSVQRPVVVFLNFF